jgi:hypothetical protein
LYTDKHGAQSLKHGWCLICVNCAAKMPYMYNACPSCNLLICAECFMWGLCSCWDDAEAL